MWRMITARNSRRDLWVVATWAGEKEGYSTLADGQDIGDLVRNGDLDQLPFKIWYERDTTAKGTRRGDLLWGVGNPIFMVSNRFLDAVTELGVAGFKAYDVEVIDRRKGPIDGYVGFAVDQEGSSELTSYGWPDRFRSLIWIVSDRVLDGLRERGVDQFEVMPLDDAARIPRLRPEE